MSLKIYHKKRNFNKTPEPSGKNSLNKKNQKNLYIIQKHAASHLHYDFRLELNGVLLSWAVPKGPSLDPSIKRLAMHVEDHPIEYGSFEGIIPKGEYGGGTVMLWDKGEWHCEDSDPTTAYKQGHLKFTLKAKKLNGLWKLVRINKDDKTWLLIKGKDEYAKSSKLYDITIKKPNSIVSQLSIEEIAENFKKVWGKMSSSNSKNSIKNYVNTSKKSAAFDINIDVSKSPFPKKISPQLATLVDHPPSGKNWIHEIKFDGYRLIIFKKNNKVTIYTRNGNDWTSKFKSIAKEIAKLSNKNFIVDGEVVVFDKNHRSNFQLLQNSIKEQYSEFIYYLFDILYYDHYNLMKLPLIKRKDFLQQLFSKQDSTLLRYSDHVFGSGKSILAKSCKLGLEGIISKDSESHYSQMRDKYWLKSKCIKRQEFIIGGYLTSDKRNAFKSLMLGTYNKKGELIYNGNVGTGFTEASLATIYKELTKHQSINIPFLKRPPRSRNAIWVDPVLIAEVEFTEWTDNGTLRHPSFKGLRNDKPSKQITKEIEVPVKSISKKSIKIIRSSSFNLSNPNKILYPEDNFTKQDIANYYDTIHDWILPYIINRPITLVRCPHGYHKCFYQKHLSGSSHAGLHEVLIKEKKGDDKYIYINNKTGLMSFTQMGALEIHTWGSNIKTVEYPDLIIFDLDPAPEVPWKRVVKAAFEIKKILADFNLKCFVKTTGGKGLHIVVPIKPEYDWNTIKNFSHTLVKYLVLKNDKEYIDNMIKSKRTNKIYIDYHRNRRGATFVAPYSTRARIHAPISVPLDWDELSNNKQDTAYDILTLPQRLNNLKKDPWNDFFKSKQSLSLDRL